VNFFKCKIQVQVTSSERCSKTKCPLLYRSHFQAPDRVAHVQNNKQYQIYAQETNDSTHITQRPTSHTSWWRARKGTDV